MYKKVHRVTGWSHFRHIEKQTPNLTPVPSHWKPGDFGSVSDPARDLDVGTVECRTDALPTQSIASDANFLAGYYLNHGNKLLVGAAICSKSLCSMCLQHVDKKIQWAKFCPQKQRYL